MKDGNDFFPMRQRLQFRFQMLVGAKRHDSRPHHAVLAGRSHPLETHHFAARLRERIGEHDAQAAGGEIGDSAHLIDRFVTGSTGDNNSHSFGIR